MKCVENQGMLSIGKMCSLTAESQSCIIRPYQYSCFNALENTVVVLCEEVEEKVPPVYSSHIYALWDRPICWYLCFTVRKLIDFLKLSLPLQKFMSAGPSLSYSLLCASEIFKLMTFWLFDKAYGQEYFLQMLIYSLLLGHFESYLNELLSSP